MTGNLNYNPTVENLFRIWMNNFLIGLKNEGIRMMMINDLI
jgi:hypothetical protein